MKSRQLRFGIKLDLNNDIWKSQFLFGEGFHTKGTGAHSF